MVRATETMAGTPEDVPAVGDLRTDPRMRRARLFTIGGVVSGLATCLVFACVGLGHERDPLWVVLGAFGLLLVTAGLGGALYRSVTPWLAPATARRLLVAAAGATVLSVPLVGPVGADSWHTWAFVGAAVVASATLVAPLRYALVVMAGAVALSAATAWWFGGSVRGAATVAAGLGLSVALYNWLHQWVWRFVVQTQEGRDALTRLAQTEERLRFARDVHDLLGHNLSVIALKAELASRLATVDAERAAKEADEVRALAASALTEMRAVVHGYRRVDLRDQVNAVAQVLRSADVRCTVVQPDEDLPPGLAAPLVPVLREASTNVMRHSSAKWCTIKVVRQKASATETATLTVTNDGANGTGPDHHSHGLRGLADRLGDSGGSVRTWEDDGVFTLEATVRAGS